MSAVPKPSVQFAAMRQADLADVARVEHGAYGHPWSYGNFSDSLGAGYVCRVLRRESDLIGYFILQIAVDEAHLLNLTVEPSMQRQGYGRLLLDEVLRIVRTRQVRELFLEVRPSNVAALALYRNTGFRQIGLRRGYYPAASGREDAIVLACVP